MSRLLVQTGYSRGGGWPVADAVVLLAVWLDFVALFFSEWSYNEQYSYGFAVPFLSAYLLYARWDERPMPEPGSRLWTFSLMVLAAGYVPLRIVLGANPEWRLALWAYALLAVGMTLCVVGRWGGRHWVRHFVSPLLLVLFAVPWFTFIENPLTHGMMRLVTAVTVECLNLAGIPALSHGNLIQLSNAWVGVEEACSGVRSFQSTLMAAYFFGVFFRWTPGLRALLILAGCAVSFALNLGRSLTLALVTARRGAEAMDMLHDPFGHVVSYGSYLSLFGLAWLVQRYFLATRIRKVYWAQGKRTPLWLPGWATGVTLGLLLVGHGVQRLWYADPAQTASQAVAATLDWQSIGHPLTRSDISPNIRNQLRYSEGHHVSWRDTHQTLWTTFFFRWEPGAVSNHVNVHRPEHCMPASGFTIERELEAVPWDLAGIPIQFKAYLFSFSGRRMVVYYGVWDAIPGSTTPVVSDWRSRLVNAWHGRRMGARYSLQVIIRSDDVHLARHQFLAFLQHTLQKKD
jgi:exosortase